MTGRRFFLSLLAVSALAAFPAAAQDLAPIRPTSSLLVPNSTRIPLGPKSAFSGGAFVARASDSSANWYNPAGLVDATGLNVATSSDVFDFTTLGSDGLTSDFQSTYVAVLPSFTGVVAPFPGKEEKGWAIGWYVAKPIAWVQHLDYPVNVGAGPIREEIFSSADVDYERLYVGLNAAWAVSKKLSFGAGLAVAATSSLESGAQTDRLILPTQVDTSFLAYRAKGNSYSLVLTGGVKADLGGGWRLGAVVRTPRIPVVTVGSASYQQRDVQRDGSVVDIGFQDADAKFADRVPLQLSLGIALVRERWDVEADVTYHGSSGRYDVFSSDALATVVVTPAGGGTPVVRQQPFPRISMDTRAILDFAVGGSYRAGDHLRLYGGLYSNLSPVGDPSDTRYRKIDMWGATAGAEFRLWKLTLALGGFYSGGTSSWYQFVDPVLYEPVETRMKVSSFGLIWAITYGL